MKIQNQLEKFINRVDLDKIIIMYFTLIIVFSFVFFFLSFTDNHGVYVLDKKIDTNFDGYLDALFFSFLTATALGYGYMYPTGVARIFSIIEVMFSLFTLGVVVSKLLSIKQEKILDELYEVSFHERVTEIISGLYNFRAEIDSTINRLNGRELTKNETEELLQNIEANLHLLSSYLIDINKILSKKEMKHLKKLSDFRADIILDNLHNSIAKIEDLISILKARNINWKSGTIIKNMELIFGTTEGICVECMSISYKNIREVVNELRRHSTSIKKNI